MAKDVSRFVENYLLICHTASPRILCSCKLNNKGCSTINVSEKLSRLLHLFRKENSSCELSAVSDDLPEYAWSSSVNVVCMCMVMCPLWMSVAARNNSDVFAHQVDLTEQVYILLKILKDLIQGQLQSPAQIIWRLYSCQKSDRAPD